MRAKKGFDKTYKDISSGKVTVGKIVKIVVFVFVVGLLVFWGGSLLNVVGGGKGADDCTKNLLKAQQEKASAEEKVLTSSADQKILRGKLSTANSKVAALTQQLAQQLSQVKPVQEVSTPEATIFAIYSESLCKGQKIEISSLSKEKACKTCSDLENKLKWPDGQTVNFQNIKSCQTLSGDMEVDLYEDAVSDRDADTGSYYASAYPNDGCVPIYEWPPLRHVKFVPGSLPDKKGADAAQITDAKFRIIYSAEAGTYMGYQSQTSYFSFLTSNQGAATYTRLVTAHKEDDLMDTIPSWFGKRHPFSKRYGPLNKPDVIAKYFDSPARPTEEVIVILDPDNWLVRSVEKWTKMVKKGTSVGEPAFYVGNGGIGALWKEVCEHNCDQVPAHQGIPYMIHSEDLIVVAPLWRHYVLKLKERFDSDPAFLNKYSQYGIQPDWCAEMFGWNFANTHAGLIQKVEWGMQLRDVATRISDEKWLQIPMIHVGRVWFPPSYTEASKWWHTEGKEFSGYGAQVWCKCNDTANDIIPWPLPPGKIDHVSNATVSLMMGAREKWGKLPFNEFRKAGPNGYHFAPS